MSNEKPWVIFFCGSFFTALLFWVGSILVEMV